MTPSKAYLFKRANGYWYIQYDDNGHIRHASTKTTSRSAAFRMLAAFRPRLTPTNDLKLSEFIQQILPYARTSYSPGTVTIYTRALRHFLSVVGDVNLSSITPKHVDTFKSHRLASVLPPTVNIDLRTLRAAFNVAHRWELIEENPFIGLKQAQTEEQFPRYFSKTDFQKLLSVIKEGWLKDVVLFAVLTGMRRGEILNLHWKDVDFERKLIYLHSTPTFRTKLGKKRVIPLNEIALHILQAIHLRSVGELVFMLNDKPIYKDWVSAKLKKYTRLLGLDPRLHFHSLRHTFASWLVQDGVSIYEVQKLLGHSNISVTQVYSHLQPEKLHLTVNRISLPLN